MEEKQHPRTVQSLMPAPLPCPVAAVMIHVGDVQAALEWYAAAFPLAQRQKIADSENADTGFECLVYGGIQLELVPADAKVASGAAGSVVYWHFGEFGAALGHFEVLGATLYRGPMDIEGGQRMAQVRDPWGNLIGLRGPHTE